MSQNVRVYFEQMDGETPCEAFYDAEKNDQGEIILHAWGMIVKRTKNSDKHNPTNIGGEVQQPSFLLDIIMEKLPKTTFERHPYSGNFNQYPLTKTENK